MRSFCVEQGAWGWIRGGDGSKHCFWGEKNVVSGPRAGVEAQEQ